MEAKSPLLEASHRLLILFWYLILNIFIKALTDLYFSPSSYLNNPCEGSREVSDFFDYIRVAGATFISRAEITFHNTTMAPFRGRGRGGFQGRGRGRGGARGGKKNGFTSARVQDEIAEM